MTLEEKKQWWLNNAIEWQNIQRMYNANSISFRERGFDVRAYIQQEFACRIA